MSHCHQDYASPQSTTGFLDSTLAWTRSWVQRLRRCYKGRIAAQHLATLEAWQLDDLGIDRRDVEDALALRWHQDPTELLEERRRKRQQGDRGGR